MPAYRFEFLSAQVGARIPDATQWDLMEQAAKYKPQVIQKVSHV
jgi:hypothetical protein